MLSPFFLPIEINGYKFDRAMQLYEFDALREPEATQYPLIGKWVRQYIEMVEIPRPEIVDREPLPYTKLRYMPDFLISNHTKAFAYSKHPYKTSLHPSRKNEFGFIDYEVVSLINHPGSMHDTIEEWCKRVTGMPLSKMVAKHHRAIWAPLFFPESLGTIFPTKFWYPKLGYAGALAEQIGTGITPRVRAKETVEIEVAHAIAYSIDHPASVLFVLDRETSIFRITDQDVCAGTGRTDHRLVIEFRGEENRPNIHGELERLGIRCKWVHFSGAAKLAPPTIANVQCGYDFNNNLNSQIMGIMNG